MPKKKAKRKPWYKRKLHNPLLIVLEFVLVTIGLVIVLIKRLLAFLLRWRRYIRRYGAKHAFTKRRVLKKRTAHQLFRTVFILTITTCTGSLAFAIATTKPTLTVPITPHGGRTTQITTPPPAAPLQAPGAPDQVGTASWYALGLPQPDALTCASTRFPRGTYLRVTDRRNGHQVTCLVNDYGPEFWTGRVIDLSRGSFRQVDDLGTGTIPVEIRVTSRPTAFELPSNAILGDIIGYRLCGRSHDPQFCEANRQNLQ